MENTPVSINKILDLSLFSDSLFNEQKAHRPPKEEIRFYLAVANGDVGYVQRNCLGGSFYRPEAGAGILSNDPVTNLKYHYVSTISIVSRFCSEAGLETEYAYRLCDYYIRLLDNFNTEEEIINLHDAVILEFTNKMLEIQQTVAPSKAINIAIDYVYEHILERLTEDDVAAALNLSRSYFSRLFRRETGLYFSEYVRKEKIKIAENLLRYSEYNLIEISNYLGFASQSHFSQVFKAETGYTPKAFRNKFFHSAWHSSFDSSENKNDN